MNKARITITTLAAVGALALSACGTPAEELVGADEAEAAAPATEAPGAAEAPLITVDEADEAEAARQAELEAKREARKVERQEAKAEARKVERQEAKAEAEKVENAAFAIASVELIERGEETVAKELLLNEILITDPTLALSDEFGEAVVGLMGEYVQLQIDAEALPVPPNDELARARRLQIEAFELKGLAVATYGSGVMNMDVATLDEATALTSEATGVLEEIASIFEAETAKLES